MTTQKKINEIRTMLSRALQELAEMTDDPQRPQAVYNALLAYVPAPLALRRGPVLVHIERYVDEYDRPYFVAKLPAVLSEGLSGFSEREALEALGVSILSFYEDVAPLAKAGNLCGSLLQDWRAFEELFEVKT